MTVQLFNNRVKKKKVIKSSYISDDRKKNPDNTFIRIQNQTPNHRLHSRHQKGSALYNMYIFCINPHTSSGLQCQIVLWDLAVVVSWVVRWSSAADWTTQQLSVPSAKVRRLLQTICGKFCTQLSVLRVWIRRHNSSFFFHREGFKLQTHVNVFQRTEINTAEVHLQLRAGLVVSVSTSWPGDRKFNLWLGYNQGPS